MGTFREGEYFTLTVTWAKLLDAQSYRLALSSYLPDHGTNNELQWVGTSLPNEEIVGEVEQCFEAIFEQFLTKAVGIQQSLLTDPVS
jgi:hypothetical protein